MDVSSNERWFAVETLSRNEMTAVLHLERQGFKVFFPRLPVTRRHARKQDTVLAALFPRYVFVCLDLKRDRWRSINSTLGVSSLVMACELPCPVPKGFIEGLAARTRASELVEFDVELQLGDPVQIVDGPLVGSIGVLMRLDEKGRVELLLNLMRTQVRVRLERSVFVGARESFGALEANDPFARNGQPFHPDGGSVRCPFG
ncbi:transcription termination/antitermination protein NusG [Xanthobacter wiegelii]|uniref:transcription termination/antitermination protein NusG n=1 Tax=Xanthobacter wiegelii TaxID=3119913 RepID=UPI003727F823